MIYFWYNNNKVHNNSVNSFLKSTKYNRKVFNTSPFCCASVSSFSFNQSQMYLQLEVKSCHKSVRVFCQFGSS